MKALKAGPDPTRRDKQRLLVVAATRLGVGVMAAGIAMALFGASAHASTRSPSKTSLGPADPLTAGHSYRHGVVPSITWLKAHQALSQTIFDSSNNLAYGGGVSGVGVTTGSEQVYLVFWGTQWGTQGANGQGYVTFSGDSDGVAPDLQAFFKGLGTGSETWSGVMTQYCQGVAAGSQDCPANATHVAYPTGGALAGVWEDISAAAPAAATAHQIAQEAVNSAAHFGNTTTSSNRDAQYVIVSPTGTDPDDYESQGFCAWHDYTGDSSLDGGGSVTGPGTPLAFTNLPYIPDAGAGCGEGFVNSGSAGALDGVTIVEGHEYAETITDQFPAGGWLDSSGNEAGDKCAWISSGQGAAQDISLPTGSFAVQSIWANDFDGGTGGCEVSHSIVTNGNTVTVTNPGSRTTTVGTSVSLQVQASDSASGQTLTYSAAGLPTGLSISSSSGLISGKPTAAGPFSVTVTVTDTTSASGNTPFSWTISPATLTITASSGSSTYGSSPPAITAGYSGFVNGDTSAALSTKPTCSTTATSSSPAGSYPSTCSGAADPNYTIGYVAGSVTVGKATQSILFTSTTPTKATVDGPTYKVAAKGGGSGNDVTFTIAKSSAGVCTISGSTVSFTGVGKCIIEANQAGNANYDAAAQVEQSFTVAAASTTTSLTFTTPVTYGAEKSVNFHASVIGSGGTPTGTVAIKSGSTTLCTITLSGGSGTCTVSAALLNAGTYSITTVYTSSSANFLSSSASPKTLVVSKAPTRIITSAPTVTITGGNAHVTMSVTLKSQTTGLAVSGQKITLTLNTPGHSVTCTAVTNASGVAACTVTVTVAQWDSTTSYRASYGGSQNYDSSSASATFAKSGRLTSDA